MSLPGRIAAATTAKAADEGSPGTTMSRPRSSGQPTTVMRLPPPSRRRHAHLGAEMAQHAFGVVARGMRLDHRGLARGVEAGQQDGALDLRRGDRQAVFDGHHLVGADDGERHAPAVARLEARAHARQRFDDALHRPAAQRGVAGHEAGEGLAGQDAREQAGRGAGVAEIEHVGGLAAAAHAEAADSPDRRRPASCTTSAPRARSAAAVHSTSSPSSRPRTVVSPSASAPNIRARWDTDLSPGARTRPFRRATGRATSLAEALADRATSSKDGGNATRRPRSMPEFGFDRVKDA